ncbi:SWI5-dependent HO expression protein 4 [Microbotryomycetes sp. JL201]|nr:SWI5-dependent HO expression protein 4 [Microbotryomycetes sp. JL201]
MAAGAQGADARVRQLATVDPGAITSQDVDTLLLNCLPFQSTAPVALAVFARWLEPERADTTLTVLKPALVAHLTSVNPAPAFAGLSAILQVTPKLGVELIKHDLSIRARLEQAVPETTTLKGKEKESETHLALADLLSQCAGQSPLRATVRQTAGTWLETRLDSLEVSASLPDELRLACTAGVAVVKLRIGTEPPEQGSNAKFSPPSQNGPWSIEKLAGSFARVFQTEATRHTDLESAGTQDVLTLSVEALAYLTLAPSLEVKPMLVKSAFIKAFLALKVGSRALDYAAATLLHHITQYPSISDADDPRTRLKAKASGQAAAPQESTESVSVRNKLIASFGPMPLIKQLCASPSLAVRRSTARALLALVTPPETRGKLIQGGAARCALAMLRSIPEPFDPIEDSAAIQALAKMLITTNPMLVIGPTPDAPLVKESVDRLLMPLQVTDDRLGPLALLIKFECLMALTNVTSFDPNLIETTSLRQKGTKETNEPITNVLQDLMIRDHVMVRRAATELVCNVCTCQQFLNFYDPRSSTVTQTNQLDPTTLSNGLSLLLALTNSEDLPTCLAASATISQLVSQSRTIALTLLMVDQKRGAPSAFERIFKLATSRDSDVGLRHRCLDIVNTIVSVVSSAKRDPDDNAIPEAKQKLARLKVRESLTECMKQEQSQELADLCSDTLTKLAI